MKALAGFNLTQTQLAALKEVGLALFEGRTLQVGKQGIVSVMPCDQRKDEKGYDNGERQRTHGSATRSRKRRQGARRAPASERTIRSGNLSGIYGAALPEVRDAYGTVRTFNDADGMWLAVRARPLGSDGPQATFIIGLPSKVGYGPRSWAFWSGDASPWIGHRHTNYPDGSICAFPPHTVWFDGDSLLQLIDFYSQWSARHIYHSVFDRWPGTQTDIGPWYRLNEFKLGELCSCGSGRDYYRCHRLLDLLEKQSEIEKSFLIQSGGLAVGAQRPPAAVSDFAGNLNGRPPPLSQVHPAYC